MDRRTFLKLSGAAGLGASFYPTSLLGLDDSAQKPLILVMFHAVGGWDPTFMFAPKGGSMSPFNPADTTMVGAIPVVPSADQFVKFMQTYGNRIVVVNGVSGITNDHFAATKYAASGLITGNHPHIGALWAAIAGGGYNLAFSGSGGYQKTAGIVPLSPILRPGGIKSLTSSPATAAYEIQYDLINAAIAARLQRQAEQSGSLPRAKEKFAEFQELRQMGSGLEKLSAIVDDLNKAMPPPKENYTINESIQSALAYCAANLTVAVTIPIGAFDTHWSHDETHVKALNHSFEAMDYFMKGAAYLGFEDRLVMMFVSDFGRTPVYNASKGKDHWPIGHAMFMGPGIAGNRVVGAIDDKLIAVKVNSKTLKNDDAGVELRPEHIHLAMRRLLGISDHPLCQQYPLAGDNLALFG